MTGMGSLLKIIIGVVLIIVSVWWIVQGSSLIEGIRTSGLVTSRPALADLIVLINGGLPSFVALIGLLIVWLELDTLKIEKEISEEEKKKK